MTGILEAISDAVGQAACGAATVGDAWWGLLSDVGVPTLGISEVAEKMRYGICGKEVGSLPPPGGAPPFEAGQCEGIPYTYSMSGVGISFLNQRFNINGQITIPGKINSLNVGIRPEDRSFPTIFYENSSGNGFVNGAPQLALPQTGGGYREIESFSFALVSSGESPDGGCGSLPGDSPPGISEYDDIIPPGTPYEDDDGNPFQLPELPIKWFPPCIGLDGIKIPFEIQTPIGKLCGKVGISPSLKTKTGFKPDVDIDQCPEQKQNLNIPKEKVEEFFELEPVGNYGQVEGGLIGDLNIPTMPEKPILGVFVTSRMKSSPPQNRTVVVPENSDDPALIVPYVALVQFGYSIEREEDEGRDYAWSEDYRVKFVKQFIPCPFPFGASAVKVRWERGWEGGYSLARRKSCCDACASNDPNQGLDNWDRCRDD